MARTFKALSALLAYPDAALQAAAGAIGMVLADEGLVDADSRQALAPLLDAIAAGDLLDLQERYVGLFDRTRRLSLHLFEHVHGESRDRGQAMVDLAALYSRGGLAPAAHELPDYLPLFLEYLSTRPEAEARATLADTLPILATLEQRLAARDADYAAVFRALRGIAGDRSGEAAAADDAPAAADDLAALDAAWEETAVQFGPGAVSEGCPVERLRRQMRPGRSPQPAA